jgi:spore coat protein CotH
MLVDGQQLPLVGVRFRGASSYMRVPAGSKRSLNISVDLVNEEQRLYGYKTLNLLNAHEDPSLLSTVLYAQIASKYLPTPKANFVRLVVNGENWGIYTNVQQFNKEFVSENYSSSKGARWKVSGSPAGGGGLEYLGDDIALYERRFEMKSGKEKDWRALIDLCRVLNETPLEDLPTQLSPLVDIDELLWFLAIDIGLINCDGYWIRASDYSIYRDEAGKFHFLPHDMNEAFRMPMGPGMGPGMGGRQGSGLALDPLIGLEDTQKPLRSRILAVPQWREQYLSHVRQLAQESLDWNYLGPIVDQYRKLIDEQVKIDTRKLSSYRAFQDATAVQPGSDEPAGLPPTGPPATRGPAFRGMGRPQLSLRAFAEGRRQYLLDYQPATGPAE